MADDARLRRFKLARNFFSVLAMTSWLIGAAVQGQFLSLSNVADGDHAHREDIKGRVVYLTDLEHLLYQWTPAIFMMSVAGAFLCDMSRRWLIRRLR